MYKVDVTTTDTDLINEIMNLVCLFYAQLPSTHSRYKSSCTADINKVAEFYGKKYATLKNRKDAYDALYENGRLGWHKEGCTIDHRPNCLVTFNKFKDISIEELELIVNEIIRQITDMSMSFFSIKTKDASTVNKIKEKQANVEMSGLNVFQDRLQVGQLVFVVFGGDNPPWETGLVGMAVVSRAPYDVGYEGRNYRIQVDVKLLLSRVIKRADLVAYKNTYDIIGIGPITKWEPNQALSQIEPVKAIALMRAMLDLDPSIATDLSALVTPDTMQRIKAATPMYDEIMVEYGGHVTQHALTSAPAPFVITTVAPFSVSAVISNIQETGLIYSDSLIKRFAFSLMAKRFLILSGLAGSGKTRLALVFASLLVEDKDKQMCVVSVGADWTNREPLLGFPNALQSGKYEKPENGVLDLLIEASRPENVNKPYFLILDEMNMSYVERYFADFLSSMESNESISLWNGDTMNDDTPQSIKLSDNLFIIGTINVDETTYMFSPKVLDRANVIEFKISSEDMKSFLSNMKEIDCFGIEGKVAEMGADFVELARKKDFEKDDVVISTLNNFFDDLKAVNAEFGYRSATEIFRFISFAKNNDDTVNKMSINEIIDAAIVQKLLPKLHGSRKKLDPALKGLWKLCFKVEDRDTLQISRDNISKAIYKESADKILRMYDSANANGFTSFAEA